MITAGGKRLVSTGLSGIRTKWKWVGPPITMGIGAGKTPGDTPGLTIHHGVLRLSTMAVGHLSPADGAGRPDQSR